MSEEVIETIHDLCENTIVIHTKIAERQEDKGDEMSANWSRGAVAACSHVLSIIDAEG